MKNQRRGRSIAMSGAQVDTFLRDERICRIATVGRGGRPHNSPLWFVWDDSALWLNSLVRSQRWRNIERNPLVSVIVDAGVEYSELRGVELIGAAHSVGEVPRTDEFDGSVEAAERLFADKYSNGVFHPDGCHAWLRMVPDAVTSWDFRKFA